MTRKLASIAAAALMGAAALSCKEINRQSSPVQLVVTTSQILHQLDLQPDALTQAPFAALLPQNGGRDPQTGRPVVQMDIILDVFGSTLAGERVSGSTRIPLDFCFDCAGCA